MDLSSASTDSLLSNTTVGESSTVVAEREHDGRQSIFTHNLIGTSPLLRPDGRAVYTPTSVRFYDSASSTSPFLSGSKSADEDLWHVDFASAI